MTATSLAMAMIEGIGQSAIGEAGKFTPTEKFLIGSSLPAMLESVDEATMKKVNAFVYPLVLTIGIGAYTIRIASLMLSSDEGGPGGPPIEPVAPTPPAPSMVTPHNGSERPSALDIIRQEGLMG